MEEMGQCMLVTTGAVMDAEGSMTVSANPLVGRSMTAADSDIRSMTAG